MQVLGMTLRWDFAALLTGMIGCVFVPPVAAAGADTVSEKVLYSFCPSGRPPCSDGAGPVDNLTDVNGMLYGATDSGGPANSGVIFALNPNTGAEQVLHSFGGTDETQGPGGSLIYVKGKLYGTTSGGEGSLFAYDLSTGAEATVYRFCTQANCADGERPLAGLIKMNGVLYGTTNAGGARRRGTIFSFNLKTGAETVIHSFGGSLDGSYPMAGLLDVNGMLYGTTSGGGSYGYGTVFSFDLSTGTESVSIRSAAARTGRRPKPPCSL